MKHLIHVGAVLILLLCTSGSSARLLSDDAEVKTPQEKIPADYGYGPPGFWPPPRSGLTRAKAADVILHDAAEVGTSEDNIPANYGYGPPGFWPPPRAGHLTKSADMIPDHTICGSSPGAPPRRNADPDTVDPETIDDGC